MMLPRLVAPSSFEALDPELRQACIARNDLVPAESSGALPELDDDDILADGGTERMKRLPLAEAEAILAAAPTPEAPIPPAPNTAPLLEDKDEEEPQRRIDKTQPFNRALLFDDNAPPRSTQPSAVWQPPTSTRTPSVAPMTPRPPAVAYSSTPKPPLALIAVIGGALLLCAVAFVTVAVRFVFSTSEEPREAQALPAHTSDAPATPPAADTGMPVISTDALPSSPYAPAAKKRSGR